MTTAGSPILPGRLGSPDMCSKDDPRADPRMVAAHGAVRSGRRARAGAGRRDSSLEELLEYVAWPSRASRGCSRALAADLPPVEGVTSSVEVIRGVDGNDVTLFIHRPTDVDGPLPGVLHLHGGGMVFLEAAGRRLRPLAQRARRRPAWSSSVWSSATVAASTVPIRSPPASTTARRRCSG